ncbi:MAG: hypothetical protein HQL51_03615 [Magnetococcales bacterium]|nr:hypothetical protein [Magnetococcales bacterium]
MAAPWIALLIFFAAFALLHWGKVERLIVMLVSCAAMLFFGWILEFYSPVMAVRAISFDSLALIFGMSMITDVLGRSGYFSVLAGKIGDYVHHNEQLAVVLLILMTYTVSLVANNLTALMIVLPVALPLCRAQGVPTTPVLVAITVAANLGGASSMIGDFPNIIIAGSAHLHLKDFVSGMMAPCLILLAFTLLFFASRHSFERHEKRMGHWDRRELFRDIQQVWADRLGKVRISEPEVVPLVDHGLHQLGRAVLVLALIGYFLADGWHWRPAWIAFASGAVLLLFGRVRSESLLSAMGMMDIAFFAGLFILVGGVQTAGVLDWVGWLIENLSMGSNVGRLLALMWCACLLTPFLNAGPATAFLIPIAKSMIVIMPTTGNAVWWALSLGILAGSSAFLSGSTTASMAVGQLNGYLGRHPEMHLAHGPSSALTSKEYARWGMPIMFLFLAFSSVYLMIIGGA